MFDVDAEKSVQFRVRFVRIARLDVRNLSLVHLNQENNNYFIIMIMRLTTNLDDLEDFRESGGSVFEAEDESDP